MLRVKQKVSYRDALKKGGRKLSAHAEGPMAADGVPDKEAGFSSGSVLREPEAAYVIGKVRDGLPLAEFHSLQELLGLTEERLAGLLGMSRATLHRRKADGTLDRSASDRLVRFARLFLRASEVLGGEKPARSWLAAPAIAFRGECPLDFADTEIGAREVEALLGRIEHGVFS
jgi:putative toxin-antitoxin system antitoxin component (TIGR02293 family)